MKAVQLLSRLFQRPAQAGSLDNQNHDRLPPELVAAKILEDLQRVNDTQGTILILVYLPTLGDLLQPYPEQTEKWRQYVSLAAREADILFIDLVDDFRGISPNQVHDLFIDEVEVPFPGATGHYSVRGNEVVARRLYEELIAFPEVASRLAEKK